MSSPLPPLAAVRAFEAAARHKSFTRAAEELAMTQASVSYQIKVLEERVGAPLFTRRARGVDLTETGLQFSRRASDAFDTLREAFADARGRTDDALLISVIPTFATTILARHLGRFQIANPSTAVRVQMAETMTDFAGDGVDLAIRSGKGRWPGLVSHLLAPADFTPMLSPTLAESIGGVHEPADLLKLPIIEPADPWWRQWFVAAGLSDEQLDGDDALQFTPRSEHQGIRFGSQVLEANATMAGNGVGILTPVFYRDALEQGRLVQPFDLTCNDGQSYWLVYPESRRNRPKIKAFRDWIVGEMKALLEPPGYSSTII